jgi:hypothetical protein
MRRDKDRTLRDHAASLHLRPCAPYYPEPGCRIKRKQPGGGDKKIPLARKSQGQFPAWELYNTNNLKLSGPPSFRGARNP